MWGNLDTFSIPYQVSYNSFMSDAPGNRILNLLIKSQYVFFIDRYSHTIQQGHHLHFGAVIQARSDRIPTGRRIT